MFLFNNAITSKEDVIINPDCTVSGNVTYGQSIEIKPGANVTGAITQDTELADIWPTADYLKDYFYDDVDTLSPPDGGFVVPGEGGDCPGIEDGVACGKVNPGMYATIGPLYWDGYLTVKNNVDGNPITALEGTIYVTDTLKLGTDGKPFTLDLNNQTIFCEKNIITGASDKLTITGSGCIIAIGDIEFKPGLNSSPDDFIFVMSVEGEALIQPLGDLYGSIAGDVNVELKPGNSLEWHDPGDAGFLNFPNEGPLVGSDTEQMMIGGWDIS